MEFVTINSLTYLTKCGENFIIFDINNDKYLFFDSKDNKSIQDYLIRFYNTSIIQKQINKIKNLKTNKTRKTITPELEREIHLYASRLNNIGTSNELSFFLAWLCALTVTALVKFGLMSYCFKYLIQLKLKNKGKPNLEKSQKLIAIINKACQWLPYKIKCLEWALCCTIIGTWKDTSIDLIIGICHPPFTAHAWVECQGQSIIDNIKYKDFYKVIFSTEKT